MNQNIKQGKVLLIPVTEVKEGMQVIYNHFIITVKNIVGKRVLINTEYVHIDQLKQLVIEYEEWVQGSKLNPFYLEDPGEPQFFSDLVKKQIPLNYSDYQQVIDNDLIGKEVKFELVHKTINSKDISDKLPYVIKGFFIAKLIPTKKRIYNEEEIEKWKLDSVELSSLKQSILESKLKDSFPKKDMSFHDKVVLAIGGMYSEEEVKILLENRTTLIRNRAVGFGASDLALDNWIKENLK